MLSVTRYSRKGEWEKGRRGDIREAAIIELKMRILRILVFLLLLVPASCGNRGGGDERHTVSFVTLGEERKLDVKIDGK
ncbi:MAG: hypothetical protein MUE32_02765, partial [Bacteroidales bacterium]|nr:hypothetical protein [Bacteroidales bacterium]